MPPQVSFHYCTSKFQLHLRQLNDSKTLIVDKGEIKTQFGMVDGLSPTLGLRAKQQDLKQHNTSKVDISRELCGDAAL